MPVACYRSAMSLPSSRMRIVTIAGSVRANSSTQKALNLVNDELALQGVDVVALDSRSLELSMFASPARDAKQQELQALFANAHGAVLATPEYQGTFSAYLKLFIEHLGYPSVLLGKPVALLGVASGRIGAVKSLEQLRTVCAHVGAFVLPLAVSVAQVHQVFTPEGQCSDPQLEKMIRNVAISLVGFTRNFDPAFR